MLQRAALKVVNAKRNGCHPLGGARFAFLLFFCLFSLSAKAVELAEIGRLAKGGASQLALSLIAEYQPAYDGDLRQWQRWERVRIRILQEHGRWAELAEHIAEYPLDLPVAFQRWSELRHASALINAGAYAQARRLLRELIWQPAEGEANSEERLAELRRLVMQSYLEEGRTHDAFAAMLRYQQDYREQDSEAMLLRAKVLLASDRAAESAALLGSMESSGVAQVLLQLARLRSGESAAAILELARDRAAQQEEKHLQWLWLGVMAEAARLSNNNAVLIIALEQMLPLQDSLQIPGSERRLFPFSAESLWQAYLDYGNSVGNREQLLIGDDEAWFTTAAQTDVRYPVRKRSLYALLAQRGSSAPVQQRAHTELAAIYQQMEEQGVALLRALYLESPSFADVQAVPHAVAYILVDDAIRTGELELASRLLQQLPQPPGGTALFAWQLRRAKVFLLAGDYVEADALLTALMPSAGGLDDQQRDQVVQLLFDLQAVGEHERAFRLLSAMYDHVPAIKLRRELLFWMADSRKAQGHHSEAARYYLKSATLSDNNSMDPWAQTARYQAAKSLGEAGMGRDAAEIYRQLLRITESKERRSVLRHELQQLRLRGEHG